MRGYSSIKREVDKVIKRLLKEVVTYYGERLVSMAIFGSYARETYRQDSDLDILLIIDRLPKGRMKRVREFFKIEKSLEPILENLNKQGIFLDLSPVIKTPSEAFLGSPLFLDMVEDAYILYDRDDFLKNILKRLKERLKSYGAKRIREGNAWYWDLKPDYQPGDIIEI